ncbi:ATP-binding protein [Vibrio scophthalmi]|uniref:ATP-binding protein n=1 Tax=Vibrio scophthalmi TaxID=45658 RepID=UPI003EB748F0
MIRAFFIYGLRCVITFILLYQFSLLFLVDPNASALSTFFPAPAFILALSFMHGLWALPIVFVAAVFAGLFDVPPWELTSFNWLHIFRQSLVYWFAGYILKNMTESEALRLTHVKTMWNFIFICLGAAFASGLMASGLFYAYEYAHDEGLHKIVISFFIGDLTGLLMFAPFAFGLEYAIHNQTLRIKLLQTVEAIRSYVFWACIAAIALSSGIFALAVFQPILSAFHYLLILPVALIAAKYGLKVGITVAFVVNVLAALMYVKLPSDVYTITEIQTLFAVTAFIAILLGSYYDNQKMANEQLRDNQIMLANLAQKSSLNELSSTIAHEVASPLQAALMNSQLSISLLKEGETIDRRLLLELNQDVEFALNKAMQIHHRIYKGVLANGDLNVERVYITECIDDARRLLDELICQHQVRLERLISLDGVIVVVDKLCLTQIFVNLIKNAIQAGANHIQLTAKVDGEYIVLTVQDDGCGISEDIANDIFLSLFTTKSEGLGLGLSICRTMLESFRGRIELLPAQKMHSFSGASFQIHLPMVEHFK